MTSKRVMWDQERPHFGGTAPHRYQATPKGRKCAYCNRPETYRPPEPPCETPPTRVVFRWWRGGKGDKPSLIALFPDIEARPSDGALVESYQHMGQHAAADYAGIVANSRPATPEEYVPLQRELEAEPYKYNLRVVTRR